MSKFLISFCLLFLIKSSSAQLSIRAFNYRPTGDYGFALKPANSIEIGYMELYDDDKTFSKRFRSNISITYIKMNPRMDSIPIFEVISSNGYILYPGTEIIKKWNEFRLFMGLDFAFIKRKRFFVYSGIDAAVGIISCEIINNLSVDGNINSRGIAGLRFRLGFEYKITDNIHIFATANRQIALLLGPPGSMSANDYGLGICLEF